MSRFLSSPTIYPFKAIDTGKWTWAFDRPLGMEIGPLGSGWELWTSEGFTTDLGSVPWLLRPIINPADPQCARAWGMHDYINKLTREVLPDWLSGYSSHFAAAVLYEGLALDGVPMWSRNAQHLAVIVGIAKAER